MRDIIFGKMSNDWKAAYEAGVFTEFMEQRAPGHTVLDDKIYGKGMIDFKEDIKQSMEHFSRTNDSEAFRKVEELRAMQIAADALVDYAERHAEVAKEQAGKESRSRKRDELEKIAAVCSHVPAHSPRDFWEALQYYWFVHIGVITEANPWDAFNPGRLDQHLYPFYKRDMEEGKITREEAIKLIALLYIKMNGLVTPQGTEIVKTFAGLPIWNVLQRQQLYFDGMGYRQTDRHGNDRDRPGGREGISDRPAGGIAVVDIRGAEGGCESKRPYLRGR